MNTTIALPLSPLLLSLAASANVDDDAGVRGTDGASVIGSTLYAIRVERSVVVDISVTNNTTKRGKP